jgi:hypothetical protein
MERFMRQFVWLLVVSLVALTMTQCTTETPLPSESEQLDRDNLGELDTQTFQLTKSADFRRMPVTGLRNNLLVGSYRGATASTLMRFYPELSIDSSAIDQIHSLELYVFENNTYGESPADSFRISVFSLPTNTWREADVVWDNIDGTFSDADKVSELSLAVGDSVWGHTSLPPEVLFRWYNDDENGGLLLKADDATGIASIDAYESQLNLSYIQLVYDNTSGETDTLNMNVLADATVFEYDSSVPAENVLFDDPDLMRVTNLDGFRALMRFDLSTIPQNATIHQALLTLYLDPDRSETAFDGTTIEMFPVKDDSVWTAETIAIDSARTPIQTVADLENDIVRFDSQSAMLNFNDLIQTWLLDKQPNYGLLLQSASYGSNAASYSFYTGQSDSTKTPELKIIYSLPASPRF